MYWYVSVEGKALGRDEVVNRMMELYTADAVAEVPPHDEDQKGELVGHVNNNRATSHRFA